MFSDIELNTLIKAVAKLTSQLDEELVGELSQPDSLGLTTETELMQLEAKLENLNTASTQVLLDTTIRDWRLSEGYAESDLKPEHLCEYALKLEMSKHTKQVYFSVYNKAFDRHPKDIHPMGLHGLIEIRDGVPTMSIGISPDENIIHVVSNTSNELAVIKEDDFDKPTWKPVEFTEPQYTGLCFEVDDYETFMEARTLLAHDAFGSYDFGERIVTDDNGWEIDDCHWQKTVFFENPYGGDSLKGRFELTFSENGTVITSIGEREPSNRA